MLGLTYMCRALRRVVLIKSVKTYLLVLIIILIGVYKLSFKTILTTSMNGERQIYSTPIGIRLAQNKSKMIEGLTHEFVDLSELLELLLKPWAKNQSNLVDLRKKMYGTKYNDANLTEVMFASQSSMKAGEKYQTVFFYPRGKGHLTIQRHNQLPKKSPFTQRFKSCSVVGNSGILVNGSCGKNIDRSDFVFRFNLPPIEQFVDDAGSKSNITTINPSIVSRKYKRLNRTEHQTQFIEYLLQYKKSYFWFPAFHEGLSTRLSFTAAKVMSEDARVANRSLFGRSDHNVAIARFWNITKIISSGFYMANTALAMCDEVNLYGFWPFYTDHQNRVLQYHYYEPKKFNRKTHLFSNEFRILVDLHMKGVLKLNIDTCRPT